MTRALLPLCVVLVLAGCKSRQAPSPPDAGEAPDLIRATDLHTALILVLPDVEGVRITDATATLRRVSVGESEDPLKAMAPLLEKKGWKVERVGTELTGQSPPFELSVVDAPGGVVQVLKIPLGREGAMKVYASPMTQTTETLAARLVDVPGRERDAQTFTMSVSFTTAPNRVAVLFAQQLRNLLTSGWQADPAALEPAGLERDDGGIPRLPDPLSLSLKQPGTGGVVVFERQGGKAVVHYTQPLAVR